MIWQQSIQLIRSEKYLMKQPPYDLQTRVRLLIQFNEAIFTLRLAYRLNYCLPVVYLNATVEAEVSRSVNYKNELKLNWNSIIIPCLTMSIIKEPYSLAALFFHSILRHR